MFRITFCFMLMMIPLGQTNAQDGHEIELPLTTGGVLILPGQDRSKSDKALNRGATKETLDTIKLGYTWLSKRQFRDGSWSSVDSEKQNQVASTALALLAFARSGQTHKYGDYKQSVNAGIHFLRQSQIKNGQFKGSDAHDLEAHAWALIALCELHFNSRDTQLNPTIKLATYYAKEIQNEDGSFGESTEHCTKGKCFSTALMMHGLRMASELRLTDLKVHTKCQQYLESQAQLKGLSYANAKDAQEPLISATCLASLAHLRSWDTEHKIYAQAVKSFDQRDKLSRQLARDHRTKPLPVDLCQYYHQAQMLYHPNNKLFSDEWYVELREFLAVSQVKDKDLTLHGSWNPGDTPWEKRLGRHGTTCFAMLCLVIPYDFPAWYPWAWRQPSMPTEKKP